MSYANIIAGMQTALAAVSGINRVLDYAPRTIQEAPIVYLLLDNAQREVTAQGALYTYNITATLVVRWQDNDEAEATVMALFAPLMTAFDADMTLGGAMTNGGAALMQSAEAGFQEIAGTIYRIVDFTATATELAC